MKKWIALFMLLPLMLCLAACGGEEPAKEPADDTPTQIVGETYDAGNVSAFIPTGWKAFPVSDIWSEDANAMDPDQMNIVKGGETDFDILSKPYIQIIHYEPESMLTPTKEIYENVVDLEPVVSGALTWEGFSCDDFLGNPLTILWTTNADGHQFQLNVFCKTAEGEFSLTDADVLSILSSITN